MRTGSSLDGRERVVAEVSEGVVTALEELARDCEQRPVMPKASRGLAVVVVVRGALARRDLRGFIQRPTQARRALTGQMPGSASLVGGVHGDIQAGVAEGLPGGREPLAVPSSARTATAVSGPIP